MQRYAGVIATSSDHVLLVLESDFHDPSTLTWSIPSGGVEEWETFAEGAARELLEESGLAVPAQDLTQVTLVEMRMADGRGSDSANFAIELERQLPRAL